MKFLVVIFVAVMSHVQCMSDEQRELLKKWHLECFEETKVSPELVLKLKSGHWRLDNKSLKEWTLCLLKKYNLMSGEGVFKLDNAMSMVPDKATNSSNSHFIIKRGKEKNEENDVLNMAMMLIGFAIFM